jgi:hypothetical protein
MNNHLIAPQSTFQDTFGRKIVGRLSDTTTNLPHDISERLKVARMQALSKRKVVKLQTASGLTSSGGVASLHMGGSDSSIWIKMASILPLLALVAGLFAIDYIADETRAIDIATVDTEILTDELPPDAYTDPGFTQFLRINRRD